MFTRSYVKSLPAKNSAVLPTMKSSFSTAPVSRLKTLLPRLPFIKERSRTASALISTLQPKIMKWITREKIKVDRVACPWLIKKFIDQHAEFVFLPHDTE